MNTEEFYNEQIADLYEHLLCGRSSILSKNMVSFTLHCTDDADGLKHCALIASLLERKVFFESSVIGDYKVTFYDEEENEPDKDLFDILQEYFNSSNFWQQFKIPKKYKYMVVNGDKVFAFEERPWFSNGEWKGSNPFELNEEQSKLVTERYSFADSLKLIKRP